MTVLEQVRRLFGEHRDYDQLAAAFVQVLAERDRAVYEAALLRKENRYLRRRLKDKEMRLLRCAHADALLLGMLHYSYQSTSRAECARSGIMSERRWNRACALARLAGVRDRKCIGWHDDVSAEEFVERLDGAAERVKAHGFDVLRAAMPRRGR